MRRLGLLGAVVTLLLAAGALVPFAASAASSFKASAYPATIHGSAAKGVEVIKTEAGSIECKSSFHAELKVASTTLALAPTFSECQAFGFLSATVHPNGCKYLLHIPEQSGEDEFEASFDVSCEAGKAIIVTVATCTMEIKAQSGLSSVTIVNDTEASPKRDITFDPEVTGLAYTVTADGFGCPFLGTGAKTDGTLTASSPTTLTGRDPSNPEEKIGIEVGEADPISAFNTTAYPATVHGSAAKGVEVINTEAGKLECDTALHAEIKGVTTTLALAPTYTNCSAFGFLSATVHPNGCKYLLHVTEQSAEDKYDASFDITCEAGKAIKITAGTCEVEIAAQGGLGLVELIDDTEATPKKDITFDPAVTGIAYKVLKDGFGCPFSALGSKTDGTLTASAGTTLTGRDPSNPEEKIGIEVG